jgi:uncharacterized protein YdeI (BOF family)
MSRSSATAALLAVVVTLCAGAAIAAPGGPLDGRKFKAESGEKGKAKAEDDEISFSGGLFHSKGCDTYGFKAAAYKAATKDGVTTFTAETVSPKEGTIRWKGTVTGDRVDATYVWTKAGQADIEYWLKGQALK